MSLSRDDENDGIRRVHPLLFRVAFAVERPCYCYGCICLTLEERRYQRRVFRIARLWSKQLGYPKPANADEPVAQTAH